MKKLIITIMLLTLAFSLMAKPPIELEVPKPEIVIKRENPRQIRVSKKNADIMSVYLKENTERQWEYFLKGAAIGGGSAAIISGAIFLLKK